MKTKRYALGIAVAAALSLTIILSPAAQKNAYANEEDQISTTCKSAYLCDAASGTVIYEHNATERLPIASMCKIMTLLLSFEEVEKGNLSYDENITVSERAAGMGGSQVYLQAGLTYTAEELMKTVAVCSANDSCVALAERICGSESQFVDRMNARAKELGADNTLFANCTGLPKEPQYSCAKDVSTMLRALLRHEKYYEFSKIWMQDFSHPDGRTTNITNTNKLIRFYEGCDGGKTGFTQQAGFCLAATAKRGDMRLISVVIGSQSSSNRFLSTKNMLNYAFAHYETKTLYRANCDIDGVFIPILGGKEDGVSVKSDRDVCIFTKRGSEEEYDVKFQFPNQMKAPIDEKVKVGELVLLQNGVEINRYDLYPTCSVERFSWWDAFKEGAQLWN